MAAIATNPKATITRTITQNIPGRSWNKNLEINVFPRYQRKKIWNALMEAFPGRKLLVTDCGITKEFTIPYKK